MMKLKRPLGDGLPVDGGVLIASQRVGLPFGISQLLQDKQAWFMRPPPPRYK
jgi:hypothetical protein